MSLAFPNLMPQPWWSGGANAGTLVATSVTSVTGGVNASLADGFPIQQMTSPINGGLPPNGGDFNGILNWITTFQVWVNSGGQFPFNTTLAAAISGYLVGAVLQLTGGTGAVMCTTANNSNNPNSVMTGWQYAYGLATQFITSLAPVSNASVGRTDGAVYFNTVDGLVNQARTGSTYDWSLLTPTTGVVGGLLTGTVNLSFPSSVVTAASFVGNGAGLTGLGGAVQGVRSNLQCTTTGASVTVTETVNQITLTTATGAGVTLGPLALSGALTSSGANGLDSANPQACVISVTSPAVVTLANHGFFGANGYYSAIVFAGTVPTGLTAGTTYWVKAINSSTFNVSATPGGVNINTTAGSSSATVASTIALGSYAGWYSKWEVYNGTLSALLFSSSATNPNLPTGYTYKARTGWVQLDSSANHYPLHMTQFNDKTEYVVGASGNVLQLNASPLLMATGSQTWPYAVSVAPFVPPTASQIDVRVIAGFSSGTGGGAAPNNSYTSNNFLPLAVAVNGGGFYGPMAVSKLMSLESTNIYYDMNDGSGYMSCLGYTDNL